MKRRNLMIGLGILATGSGAATLSGAALSNTVSPTADFRINVEGGLVVRAGSNFPDSINSSETGVGTDNAEYILSEDTTDAAVFESLDDKTSVTAVADTEQNGDLNIGLAFPFSEIEGGSSATFNYPNLLEVENNSNSPVDVAVAYQDADNPSIETPDDIDSHGFESVDPTYPISETGDGDDQLSFDQVANMFQFDSGGTAVSPAGADSQSNSNQSIPGSVSVDANGGTTQLSLTVDVNSNMAGIIDSYVSNQNLTTDGGNVPLVDAIWVGEYS